jgi:hypothetical protein
MEETNMARPIVRIHNIETNEVIDREMNDQEFAAYEADQAAQAAAQAEAEAKAAQRQALLTRLGITEEEARILLGGN